MEAKSSASVRRAVRRDRHHYIDESQGRGDGALLPSAPAADAAWAAYILSGRRLKRFIGPALLRRWLIEASGLPEWLVDEAYSSVGDMAETIALLMETDESQKVATDIPLADWIDERLLPLRDADEARPARSHRELVAHAAVSRMLSAQQAADGRVARRRRPSCSSAARCLKCSRYRGPMSPAG